MTSHTQTRTDPGRTPSGPAIHDDTPVTAVEAWIRLAADTAAEQLRWVYTLHYRRHHRNGDPSRYGDLFADQIACSCVRYELPVILARHLPGVELVEWVDPHQAVLDSTWTLHGWTIAVYWDYHSNWRVGDAHDLRVHPAPPGSEDQVAA